MQERNDSPVRQAEFCCVNGERDMGCVGFVDSQSSIDRFLMRLFDLCVMDDAFLFSPFSGNGISIRE